MRKNEDRPVSLKQKRKSRGLRQHPRKAGVKRQQAEPAMGSLASQGGEQGLALRYSGVGFKRGKGGLQRPPVLQL